MALLVLGSWVGVRCPFHLSLFLTASRVVLPKILVLTTQSSRVRISGLGGGGSARSEQDRLAQVATKRRGAAQRGEVAGARVEVAAQLEQRALHSFRGHQRQPLQVGNRENPMSAPLYPPVEAFRPLLKCSYTSYSRDRVIIALPYGVKTARDYDWTGLFCANRRLEGSRVGHIHACDARTEQLLRAQRRTCNF